MRGYEYLLVCSAYMLSERESTYELLQHHIWEWRRWWKRYKDDIWSTSSCRLPCRSQTSGTWCWWRLASPPQPRKLKNLLSEIFYITSTNFGIRDFLYYQYEFWYRYQRFSILPVPYQFWCHFLFKRQKPRSERSETFWVGDHYPTFHFDSDLIWLWIQILLCL